LVGRNHDIPYDKLLRHHPCLKNLRPFFGQATLAEITPKVIAQYKAKRYQAGVKPAPINREMALMKHAFNLAIKEWEWAKGSRKNNFPFSHPIFEPV